MQLFINCRQNISNAMNLIAVAHVDQKLNGILVFSGTMAWQINTNIMLDKGEWCFLTGKPAGEFYQHFITPNKGITLKRQLSADFKARVYCIKGSNASIIASNM